MIVDAEGLPGGRLINAGKGVADGVADHLEMLAAGDPLFGLREGEEDGLGHRGQHLGGDAGEGVLLMEEDRYPHLLRLADDRPRDIAAGADGHIGVKIFDNLFRPVAGEGEPVGRLDVVGDVPGEEAAVKTGDLDVGDGVPLFRDHCVLHIPRHRREKEFRPGVDFRQFPGDGDGGVDVSPGAAPG